jgi:hypothetical protein
MVTFERPPQHPAVRNHIAFTATRDHRAIRQPLDRYRQFVQPFFATREPLAVEHSVHLGGQNTGHTVARFPRRAKPQRVVAAAVEARAVSGRERGCLVKKEQLSPTAAAITGRRRPLNSQTQVIQALLAQRRVKVLVAGS